MSYIRNYIIIALGLYGLSVIKCFLQINFLWTPWHSLKTTNLFIMYYMERLYAHMKKVAYSSPIISTNTKYIEDIKDKMDTYGLKRDKVYCILHCILINIENIFGISRSVKRNYLSVILTLLFTKRALLKRLIIKAYNQRGQYKSAVILQKVYAYIKRVNPDKVKHLMAGIALIIVIVILIKIARLLIIKYRRKAEAVLEKGQAQQSPIQVLEALNVLENKLGDAIIAIVKKVRVIDKLLAEESFIDYGKLAPQILEELSACESVIQEIKNNIPKLEQIKEVEVYGIYRGKYNLHALILRDLSKEAFGEALLKKYQSEITEKDSAASQEVISEARKDLYGYVKKCVEYYDELELYLAKVNRRKRRGRKKIYQREVIAEKQTSSEMIESYFK